MLKLVAASMTGVLAAGGVAYSYVRDQQQHIAQLTVENVQLHADSLRYSNAIEAAIKTLQAAKRGSGTP